MNRITSILFSGFFLALSVGMPINVHLCTGLMATSEGTDCSKKGCCNRGETQPCCIEKTYFIQLDDTDRICPDERDDQVHIPSKDSDLVRYSSATTQVKDGGLPYELTGALPSIRFYKLYCSLLHYG